MILLHGFPELAVSWRFQLEALSNDYRVVVPDMRGYGGTDAPPRVSDYAPDLLVGDVLDLADTVGADRFHLVGHDWGGAVAWQVGMRHADRLLSLAVCNCPPAQLLWRDITNVHQLRRSWYMFFFQVPWLPEWLMRRDPRSTIEKAFRGSAVNPEPFTDEALQPYIEQLRDRGLPGMNYYKAALRRPTTRLSTIDCPVRLIWGLGDHALGPHFANPSAYLDFCPDFTLTAIPVNVAGHWVQQEAHARVSQSLREHFEAAHARGRMRS